jgi:hypothetical protein
MQGISLQEPVGFYIQKLSQLTIMANNHGLISGLVLRYGHGCCAFFPYDTAIMSFKHICDCVYP